MTLAGAIEDAFWKASLTVAIGLILFVCLALLARWRWPTLAVRVITSLGILLVLLASPEIVSLIAGPMQRRGWSVGTYVHPGWVMQFGPAIVSILAGIAFSVGVGKCRRTA